MIITRRLLKLLFDKTKIRNVEFDRYLPEVSFSSPRRLATKGLQIPSLKMSWSCAVLIDSLKIMSYLIIMLNWWNLFIVYLVGFSVSSRVVSSELRCGFTTGWVHLYGLKCVKCMKSFIHEKWEPHICICSIGH
jgi:hypothetical protein